VRRDPGLGSSAPAVGGSAQQPGPMVPALHRVVARRIEAADVTTLALVPVSDTPIAFLAGQFNMLSAFGVGEAAISVSGIPGRAGPLEQTVRDVGPVTHALCGAAIGDIVGVRGPFGTSWETRAAAPDPASSAMNGDVVVVAGGIGLAPLRGAVYELLGLVPGTSGRRVVVLVGAREPGQIIFRDDLAEWEQMGACVEVTVDVAGAGWKGHVGVVSSLLRNAGFAADDTTALVCGPEIMMRFTARALIEQGVNPARIMVSLERNMQCGVGWCGHCQLGPFLVCRDGPVVPYGGMVADLLGQRQR